MNRIHILSIPGMLSMIALFIVMVPHENYAPNISVFQGDMIIGMALVMLSFTVVSKNRFSFVDMGFCILAVAYVGIGFMYFRSEEHTSELQSRGHLVCRRLLEQ